ncbi:AAA family ATPase [Ideonella sp. DXS29W]|uniref:AAA family ATPase n=1 Tax=Ideonella lacteola TaxID=2984193 RepID=A0ABU9BWN7_9BURK
MSLLHHIGPDQYLALETAEQVTREQVAEAWERAYAELEQRLRSLGAAARLYIVFGLQGAGKSTWIAHHGARYGDRAVFFDGPLPSRRHRQRALQIAAQVGCAATAVWIDTPLGLARERNAGRRGLARIRDEAIQHVFDHLEAPSLDEGFSSVMLVRPDPGLGEPGPDGGAPLAVGA